MYSSLSSMVVPNAFIGFANVLGEIIYIHIRDTIRLYYCFFFCFNWYGYCIIGNSERTTFKPFTHTFPLSLINECEWFFFFDVQMFAWIQYYSYTIRVHQFAEFKLTGIHWHREYACDWRGRWRCWAAQIYSMSLRLRLTKRYRI